MTREEAIDFLESINKEDTAVCCDGALFTLDEYGVEIINMAVEALENERPKGHWIRKSVDNGWHADWVCSECGHRVYFDHIYYDYCPRCGAYMRSEVCERDADYEQEVAQLEHDMRYDPTYNPEDGSA